MPTPASDYAVQRLGDRVRALRRERGWTQETLAQRAGLHEKHPGPIEHGYRNIRFTTLCALARALDLTPAQLLDDLPTDPPLH